MAVHVIDTIKPKNGGSFPIVEAVDVKVDNGVRLPDALSRKANITDLEEVENAIETKADASAMLEATTNLQNQINNIVSPTTEDAEVINSRVGANGTSYATLKARLDAETANTNDRIDKIDDLYTIGLNLFNPDTVRKNYILRSDGTEEQSTNAFISDYIEVIPGESYKVNRAISSESYPTICYYNGEKEFVSASDGTSTTFTIPNNCVYVRMNGSMTYINQGYFIPEYCMERFDYQRIIDGKHKIGYYLWSENHIFYYDGALHSKTYIYLSNQDKIDFVLGKDVPVSGSGAYLFWNKNTGELFASNSSSDLGKDVYFLSFLKFTTFNHEINFTALTCAYPAFSFDLIANKLYIDFKWYGYIFYNGQTYEIPRYYTQELNISEFSMIVFNIDTMAFESVIFDAVKTKGKYIPICIRNYGEIIGNCAYELKPYAKSYASMLCYGDSLTWYDGHEFTWGPHAGEMCVGFESYLRQYLRFAVSNVGVSGQTTPQICSRLATDNAPASAKYIILMGGDNDDRLSITPGTVLPPGSTFNTSTVAGALQYAIETVLTKNPDVRIILMTEPMGWTYRDGSMVRVDDVYPQTYRNVAALYGLPLIDLWAESGINELNREEYMIDPTVAAGNTNYIYHPSNKAWERIGKMICKVLEKY